MSVSFARSAVSPLQEAMRLSLALSDNQMAVLQGPALALPIVLGGFPLGALVDRNSRARLLLGFAWLDVVGSLITALTNHFGILLIARCVVGLALAGTNIAAVSLLADWYAPVARGRASMVMGMGQVAGASAAFALGGLLLAHSTHSNSWHWAMAWLAAPLTFVGLILFALREPPRIGVSRERSSLRSSIADLWRYRGSLGPIFGGLVLADTALGAVLIWVAPYFSRAYVISPARVGALLGAILLISGIAGPALGGVLADVVQRRRGVRGLAQLLCFLAMLSVPTGLFGITDSIAMASLLLAIFMVITPAINLIVSVLLTIVIPNEMRGLCLALSSAASILFGFVLAPSLVSLLSSALGGVTMLGRAIALVCIATSLCGALIFALGLRVMARSVAR